MVGAVDAGLVGLDAPRGVVGEPRGMGGRAAAAAAVTIVMVVVAALAGLVVATKSGVDEREAEVGQYTRVRGAARAGMNTAGIGGRRWFCLVRGGRGAGRGQGELTRVRYLPIDADPAPPR